MRKDDHLIFEALQNRIPGAGPDAALRNTGAGENAENNAQQFTVVSGGVDNTSEEGIDINPADHIHAQSLKHAVEETLGEMQNDEDFDDTFPEEYREYVKDIFMMSNDSGDFIAILPGHLNEDQIFTKLKDVRDNSENAEHVPLTLGEPDPALKNTGAGENAEASVVAEGDFFEANGEKYVCVGVEQVDGATVVHGQMLAEYGDTFPMEDVTKID